MEATCKNVCRKTMTKHAWKCMSASNKDNSLYPLRNKRSSPGIELTRPPCRSGGMGSGVNQVEPNNEVVLEMLPSAISSVIMYEE